MFIGAVLDNSRLYLLCSCMLQCLSNPWVYNYRKYCSICTESRAPSPLNTLRENQFLSLIFSSIRQRYLVILDRREALFDRVYQAEELGHLSCLLRYNYFNFIQVSFSSKKRKLDNFVRPDNLLIDINSYKRTDRTQNEKGFGTCKLSVNSACLEVLTLCFIWLLEVFM